MDDGSWRFTSHGPGEQLDLDAVGVRLHIDELYEGMEDFDGPLRGAGPDAEYPSESS
jgi:hypothetical protein